MIWVTGLWLLLSLIAARGAIYYVKPNGNDSFSGLSDELAFRTIQRAAYEPNLAPGDTVIVKDGVYTANPWSTWALVILNRGGDPSGYITFKSENKWGAILDGQNDPARFYGFHIEPPSASYVRIQDFEIRNFSKAGVDLSLPYMSNFDVSANHIHHIGRSCSDSPLGIVGIYLYGINNAVIQKNVIHDIGRFAPGENGCNLENHYQNRDHGVYIEASTRVTNKNNLFYNIARGWSIHVYSSRGVRSSDLLIANNIFAFPYPYNYGQVILAAPGVDNATIQNNIFYSPNTAGVLIDLDANPTFSGISITKNLVHAGVIKWPLQATPGITTSSNLENADALLANPHLYDFYLRPGSPAIDAGAAIAEVADDIIGRSRPQGRAWDIGPYEYAITSQPQHKIVTASENATFTVALSGTVPFTCQWRKNGVNLVNGGNISGATSPALTVANTSASDAATYDVVVSEAGGGQFPSAPAQLSVVTQLPVSQQVDPGVTVQFQVLIAGTTPSFSYQWKKNNVQNNLQEGGNISGTQTPSLQITNVSSSDVGYYRLYITNKPAFWFNTLSARLILNE